MNICFQYDFHPVGQGLFASGCLYKSKIGMPWFLWVYDCGSVSHKRAFYWQAKASELKRFTKSKREIDLLTLSHFDNDHINGVTGLLRTFEVGVLLLPYTPLWERLIVAFARGIAAADPVMAYYVDPIAYLRAIEGAIIRRIIIVGPSEGEGPPVQEEPPNTPDNDDGPPKLDARTKPIAPDDDVYGEGAFGSTALDLQLLPPGQALTLEAVWEFCPYNAPRRKTCNHPSFRADVESRQNQLLKGRDDERVNALNELKASYDLEFGAGGMQRNVISLFVYAGPIYMTWRQHKMLALWRIGRRGYPCRYPCYRRIHDHAPGRTSKCSLLYSGDGYLNDGEKYDHLYNYLQPQRMSKLGVFQVNHHGAKRNWHPGLAAKVDAAVSVFSSRPSVSPYHPHAEVLRDYWSFTPIQVDTIGCTSAGWLLR